MTRPAIELLILQRSVGQGRAVQRIMGHDGLPDTRDQHLAAEAKYNPLAHHARRIGPTPCAKARAPA